MRQQHTIHTVRWRCRHREAEGYRGWLRARPAESATWARQLNCQCHTNVNSILSAITTAAPSLTTTTTTTTMNSGILSPFQPRRFSYRHHQLHHCGVIINCEQRLLLLMLPFPSEDPFPSIIYLLSLAAGGCACTWCEALHLLCWLHADVASNRCDAMALLLQQDPRHHRCAAAVSSYAWRPQLCAALEHVTRLRIATAKYCPFESNRRCI